MTRDGQRGVGLEAEGTPRYGELRGRAVHEVDDELRFDDVIYTWEK